MATRTGFLSAVHLTNLAATLAATRQYALGTLYVQFHPAVKRTAKCTTTFGRFMAQLYQSSVSWIGTGVDLRIVVSSLKSDEAFPLSRQVDYLFSDYPLSSGEGEQLIARFRSATAVELHGAADFGGTVKLPDVLDQGEPTYGNVVLGGTFDRLHAGHKVLLTQAILLAEERLVVGVTDTTMIRSKKLHELILPVEQRIHEVHEFLRDVDGTLRYEVVPISDPFGPTATDPKMDMIVVSTETARGGQKVNELREKNGLGRLAVRTIELLDDESTVEDKEDKISSSNQRMDLLGSRLRAPVPKPHLPRLPHVVGLVGGVASGKSKMRERFEKLGAGVIDMDRVAHELYEPGQECYDTVVSTFGREILREEDGSIDRKALGAIVFADPGKLEQLNRIMWGAMGVRANEIARTLYEQHGKDVVIMEAAILFQAGWDKDCHEIWSCIVPEDEAVRRVMDRNQLAEDQAKQRVALTSNEELVRKSDIVFCTVWSYDYSQQQAEKAWNNLRNELKLKL